MAVLALDKTTVTNPPRDTDPAELREYADLIAAGEFAGDGVMYLNREDAVKIATRTVRGIKWLGRDGLRPVARYSEKEDGTFQFYVKNLPPLAEGEDEDEDEGEDETPAK